MTIKNLFRNDTKIKEAKDLTIPISIALAIVAAASLFAIVTDIKQNKELDRIEQAMVPTDETIKHYKTQVKQYFANYLASEDAVSTLAQTTGVSEKMMEELIKTGIFDEFNALSDDDLEEIIRITTQELSSDSIIRNSSTNDKTVLYNTIYSKVLNNVRKNLNQSKAFTITQTKTYDIPTIVRLVQNQVNQMYKQNTTTKTEEIDIESIRDTYVKSIVNTLLSELEVSVNDQTRFENNVRNKLQTYYKSEEGQSLMKTGVTPVVGEDFYTDEETAEFIDAISNILIEEINAIASDEESAKNLYINAIQGRSIIIDNTNRHIDTKVTKYGNKTTVKFAWQRLDDEKNVTLGDQYEFDSISYGKLTFEEVASNKGRSIAINEKENIEIKNLYINYESISGAQEKIDLYDLTAALTNAYIGNLDKLFNETPIGIKNGSVSFDADTQTYSFYCNTHNNAQFADVSGKTSFKNITEINGQLSHVTDDGLCVAGEILTAESFNAYVDETVTNMKTVYDDIKSTRTSINENANLTELSQQTEIEILNIYETLLNTMDQEHPLSIFMQCQDNPNILLPTQYNDISSDIRVAAAEADESIFIYNSPYIERHNGKLEFTGLTSRDKIDSAQKSQIINIMDAYIKYMTGIDANGSETIISQLNVLKEKSENISKLYNLMFGNGIVITVSEDMRSSNNIVISNVINAELLNAISDYTGTDHFTVNLPLHFTIIDNPTNSLSDYYAYSESTSYIDHVTLNLQNNSITISCNPDFKLPTNVTLNCHFAIN